MIKPALDQLYLYALLQDAPDAIRAHLTSSMEVLPKWKTWCQQAENLALGSKAASFSNSDAGKPLQSIFSLLFQTSTETEPSYVPAAESAIGQTYFPVKDLMLNDEEPVLWEAFLAELKKLCGDNTGRRAGEICLQLLHKYTANLPCRYAERPTVSHYELARLRAGLVVAIAQTEITTGADGEVLLIGGDVSGIQDFLYDIVSKNAARNLKGRSFYLYLLVNNIIDYLKRELGLYTANIVYDSGGNFLLSAPNTEAVVNTITSFEEMLNKDLFSYHKTSVYCCLAHAVFKEGKDLKSIYEDITDDQKEKKSRRFLNKVFDYDELFNPEKVELGGRQARDVITGEEITSKELETTWFFDPANENDLQRATEKEQEEGLNLVTETTAYQILLGQKLKRFDYWIKSDQPLDVLGDLYISIHKDVHFEVLNLAGYNYILSENDLEKYWSVLQGRSIKLLTINSFTLPTYGDISDQWEIEFHLYGGNYGPSISLEYARKLETGSSRLVELPKTYTEMSGGREDDRLKAFKQVYQEQTTELDFKRLGVLRMDVDNLGKTFREGISDAHYCLANYCVLSRNMDYFFKGYLNFLWQSEARDKERSHYSQIVYAGGDDLFLVGRWDVLYRFAMDIKKHFSEWTTHNPALGISGGLVIVTHKYPIMKAANMASDEEKTAKTNTFKDLKLDQFSAFRSEFEKDSFTLFGRPLRWQAIEREGASWMDEFALVHELYESLANQLRSTDNKHGLPISMLQKIHQLNAMRTEAVNQQAWKWNTAYVLSQMKTRLNKQKQYRGEVFIAELEKAILFGEYREQKISGNYPFLEFLSIAARLAELDRRTLNALERTRKSSIVSISEVS